MSHSTCLTVLNDAAMAMFTACQTDLLPITGEDFRKKAFSRRPTLHDLQGFEMFQQMWGSTALGFGGIGGAAMTTTNVCIVTGQNYEKAVYFGSRFAYLILRPNDQFFEDVNRHQMAAVGGAKKRYEKD